MRLVGLAVVLALGLTLAPLATERSQHLAGNASLGMTLLMRAGVWRISEELRCLV